MDINNLKYMILGVGGTGGAVGSHLAEAGHDVTFIARGRHLKAMRENGLRVIRPDREFCVKPVKAYSTEEYLELIEADNATHNMALVPDVIIVCVKGYSIPDVIPFIRKAAGPDTVVIPILNIFGTGGEMQKELPDITVTDGCIYVASEIREPGVIWMNGTILRVVFGLRREQRELLCPQSGVTEPQSGERSDLLARVESDMNDSGIRGILSDNIERDAMRKFSYVSPQGACGLYYDATASRMQEPGEARDLFAGLIAEIASIAEAMGIGFEDDVVAESLNILDGLAPSMTTSLQRDIAAGKSSEIDGLIYNVVKLGKEYGVNIPLYTKLADELRARGL